jgi:hypothetical protein
LSLFVNSLPSSQLNLLVEYWTQVRVIHEIIAAKCLLVEMTACADVQTHLIVQTQKNRTLATLRVRSAESMRPFQSAAVPTSTPAAIGKRNFPPLPVSTVCVG